MSTVFNFTFVPWFRSVAPYIHMHRGKTFVVGIAGEAIAAGKLQHLAQDLALIQSMGVKVVLVHGFRPQVNEQLLAKGHVPKYSHGIRITDEVALDCAQEAAGQLRYEIEAAFSQGLPNTPMAGSTVRVISGNFITARPVGVVDGVDFQHSGLVRKVDVAGITRTLSFGAMVLLSPFGFSPTGEAFNLPTAQPCGLRHGLPRRIGRCGQTHPQPRRHAPDQYCGTARARARAPLRLVAQLHIQEIDIRQAMYKVIVERPRKGIKKSTHFVRTCHTVWYVLTSKL